jgi:predicted membrane metal-binding protein
LLPSALSFLAGILLIQQLPEPPSHWWGLLLAPALVFAWYRPASLPFACFLAGIYWVTVFADARLQDQLSAELEGGDMVVEGVIDSIPRKTAHGSRFEFVVESTERIANDLKGPGRIQLSLYRSALTLFSIRYLNRYRHPNEQAVQRYLLSGSEVLMTPATGAIQTSFSRRGRVASRWRQENRRFWFHLP